MLVDFCLTDNMRISSGMTSLRTLSENVIAGYTFRKINRQNRTPFRSNGVLFLYDSFVKIYLFFH